MGNKYVSLVGNNANTGTGPLSSQAWLTLEYAVDTMSDGDVLYVAPGIYRECITIGVTPTVETIIRGDPLNTQGFKDGSSVLIPPGPVIVTNMLTDDVTASTNMMVVDCNGKSNLTFEKLWVESMSASRGFQIVAACTNIVIRDCHIFSLDYYGLSIITTADTTHNHLIERCTIVAPGARAISLGVTKTNTAPGYDAGIVIRNCTLVTANGFAVYCAPTGTATYFGGGVIVQNCFCLGTYGFDVTTGYNATLPDAIKMQLKNCICLGFYGAYQANVAGGDSTVLVEDWNFLACSIPRTNVSIGANSISYGSSVFARSIRHDCGQSQLFGFLPKSFMAPWNTSRTIGYGNDSTPAALDVDIWNRVRPSGCGVAAASVLRAVGAHELHEFGAKEITIKDAGDASIKLTGPGDHDILVPVDTAATVISLKVRFDSATYGGVSYPQVILLSALDIGQPTADETETATVAASDAWETLTFTSFTPTLKGWVKIRLLNRSTTAAGICYFDTVGIA